MKYLQCIISSFFTFCGIYFWHFCLCLDGNSGEKIAILVRNSPVLTVHIDLSLNRTKCDGCIHLYSYHKWTICLGPTWNLRTKLFFHFWRPIFAVTVKIRFTALKIWHTAHSVPVTKKHSQAASTLELCSNLTLWAYFKSPLETMDGSRRSCDAPMSISLRAIANIPPPHTFTLQFLEKNLSAVADPILLQLYLLSVMFPDSFFFFFALYGLIFLSFF